MLALAGWIVLVGSLAALQPDDDPNSIPAILARMKSKDARTRLETVAGLFSFDEHLPAALRPAVVERLKDEDKYVRGFAAWVLINREPLDPELLRSLCELLSKDKEPHVRARVAESFGDVRRKAKEALPFLIDALKDPEKEVQAAAAYAVLRIDRDHEKALRTLFAVAQDPATPRLIRSSAVGRLRYVHRSRADAVVPVLIGLLDDPEESLQAGSILSFYFPAKAAVPALKKKLAHPDVDYQCLFAMDLARIDPTCAEAVPILIGALKDRNNAGRTRALGTFLIRILYQATIDLFEDGLEFDPRSAANAVYEDCKYALLDTNHSGRDLAANHLGLIGPTAKPAVPELTAALRDPHPQVRFRAAGALAKIEPGNAEALQLLIRGLKEENGMYCYEVLFDLGKCGASARPAIPAIAELFNEEHRQTHSKAAIALIRIDPTHTQAFNILLDDLRSQYSDPRRLAARTLGELGPRAREAVRLLKSLLNDEEEEVREAAEEALRRIEGGEAKPDKCAIRLDGSADRPAGL